MTDLTAEHAAALAAATQRAEKAERENTAFVNDVWTRLADPNAVHLNMLRGTIAKPSLAQIEHLYPEVGALRERADRAEAALREARRKAIEEAAALYDHGMVMIVGTEVARGIRALLADDAREQETQHGG